VVEQGTHKPLVTGSNPVAATWLTRYKRVKRNLDPPEARYIIKKGGMPLAPLKPLLQEGWKKLTRVKNPEWRTLAEARLRPVIF
jgi:hypothetical protein